MAEPTEAEIELGHAIINDYIEGDRKLVPCGNRIAQALATARADGISAWLKTAELHEITEAACKRATAEGLDITIRVKPMRKRKEQSRG